MSRQRAMLSLPEFAGVALVVIVTPGPDTAITVRNALIGGRMAGLLSAVGVGCGQLTWVFATSLGILAVLSASPSLFLALKFAGAAYLVLLGIRALQEAFPREKEKPGTIEKPADERLSPLAAFRQGLLSNLGNPKIAIFYASILPQVAPPLGSTARGLILLGVTFSLIAVAWLTFYAVLVTTKFGDVLRHPATRAWVEGAAGSLLVILGVSLALER